jgi:hypothetical protein
MAKIPFYIPIPDFIAHICVWFLLRYRKKHYGIAFRKIKLTGGKNETKMSAGTKPVETNFAAAKFAIVDPEDYQKLSKYNWECFEKESNRYAIRLEGRKIVSMHREIMNAPDNKVVHHEDGNGLNNTKKNLRIVTVSENNKYVRKRGRAASSKYKGVSLEKRNGKWRAGIKSDGKYKSLGYFENEEDAARAYDEAAKIYHGQFAVLNFGQTEVNKLKNVIS